VTVAVAADVPSLHHGGMQVKPRGRAYTITSVGPYSGGRRAVRRRRRWPWVLLLVFALVLAALGLGRFAWPSGALSADPEALARVAKPSLGNGVRVSAHTTAGAAVPIVVRSDGTVWPRERITAGTQLVVEADFRRPGWAGWLAGGTQHATLNVVAPTAALEESWLHVKPGAAVAVRFDRPVRKIRVSSAGTRRIRHLPHPARTVVLGRLGDAGSVAVSATVRSWEKLPPAVDVTWFPLGGRPRVLVSPRQGTAIDVDTPLRLTVSEPLGKLFHNHLPWLGPSATGGWVRVDKHTLLYRPRGYGYGLDTVVKVRLPAAVTPVAGAGKPTRLLTWSTPTGSELRLQQLLAEMGYMPLGWNAGAEVAGTLKTQVAAAVHPPAGSFSWRFSNVPDSLVHLWRSGKENVVTRGAVMAFQSSHDLLVDGYAGRDVWRALIADAVAGKRASGTDYSYVIVHRGGSPQSLTLWRNGQVILTTPANTGIPKAPTALGTFPVYARFVTTTMRGTNPDGSHYSDPGVPWVSYFNGGDAIHGFNRASYGSAQSLGCVELLPSEAERVFPYTPIGTLVTVAS
jgi:peptidoglycan hydrolase-like protein with peptidoglycan-binding domain